MICPQCGNSVPDDAQFCATCGRQLAPVAADPDLPGEAHLPLETSSKAIASLILGIIPLSIISSIPAVVLGHLALSEIKKSGGRLGGRGLAVAGLVLGYLGIALVPVMLILGAIAIPNLLRARIAANESSAVNSIRTLVVAETSYQATYPKLGYAPDLQSLGSGSSGCGAPGPTNACLIEDRLAQASSAPGKNGYIFSVTASANRKNFLVTAVPASRNQSGVRSFCAAEDGEVHLDLSGGPIADLSACAKLPNLE